MHIHVELLFNKKLISVYIPLFITFIAYSDLESSSEVFQKCNIHLKQSNWKKAIRPQNYSKEIYD